MITLKTFIQGTIVFCSLLLINIVFIKNDHPVLLDNINTFNIVGTIKDEDLPKVKKICSYDFCDYIRSKDVKSSMELFIKKYLNQNRVDDETKKTIYVKGLKITKIIYYD